MDDNYDAARDAERYGRLVDEDRAAARVHVARARLDVANRRSISWGESYDDSGPGLNGAADVQREVERARDEYAQATRAWTELTSA